MRAAALALLAAIAGSSSAEELPYTFGREAKISQAIVLLQKDKTPEEICRNVADIMEMSCMIQTDRLGDVYITVSDKPNHMASVMQVIKVEKK